MAEAENKMKRAVDKHISLSVLTRPDSLLCDTEILICINVNCEAKILIIDSCFLSFLSLAGVGVFFFFLTFKVTSRDY